MTITVVKIRHEGENDRSNYSAIISSLNLMM